MPVREIEGIEELKTLVGQEVSISDWIEISQERINKFAEATEDFQWIHVDAERCKTDSPFGKPIAHGYLTMSLLSAFYSTSVLIRQKFKMTVNMGISKLRFMEPVPVDSRVRCRSKLLKIFDIKGGWQLNWRMTVEIEKTRRPACVVQTALRYYALDS